MAHLAELEFDSLDPGMSAAARVYQDSVRGWLVEAVDQATRLGDAEDVSDFLNRKIQEVPDSALLALDTTVRALSGRGYDLPLPSPVPSRVLRALQVFTGFGRGYFARWLQRKSRFEAFIAGRLAERGLPKDLLYLAMVESGFNPMAWSHAKASGLWQFIGVTARRYGLRDDWWVDERRDPTRATEAALDYLEDLHAEFGDWHLAMAAYNCGENRIRKQRERDSLLGYWDMDLPVETRFYIPKILAAMIIGHDPEAFGFPKDGGDSPWRGDTVTARRCLMLRGVARVLGITEDSLKSLNPSLRRWCTPPGRNAFCLRLPEGGRDRYYANIQRIDTATLTSWRRHAVGRGENLLNIASRYGVSIAAIQGANRMRNTRLRKGQVLIIPVPEGAPGREPEAETARARSAVAAQYKVQKGETLYDLARRFRISVSALRAANGMPQSAVLNAGKTLRIPQGTAALAMREEASVPQTPVAHASRKVYVVRKGESLYSIAKTLGLKQDELRQWNGLRGTSVLVGQKLVYHAPPNRQRGAGSAVEKIAVASAPLLLEGPQEYYRVKAGDTLWDISSRFGRSLDELKKLNNNLSELLRPGQKIRIR